MGQKFKKELDVLFFNLINESERDFLTLAIKIHIRKSLEMTLTWTKLPEIQKFLYMFYPWTTGH